MKDVIDVLSKYLPVWLALLLIAAAYVAVQFDSNQREKAKLVGERADFLKEKLDSVVAASSILERAAAQGGRDLTAIQAQSQSLLEQSKTEPAAAAGQAPAPAPEPEPDKFSRAWRLLHAGSYAEGMRLLREHAAEGDSAIFAQTIAMGQFIAWNAGAPDALRGLEETVRDHPTSARTRSWLVLAYSKSERHTEALEQSKKALELAGDDGEVQSVSAQAADAFVALGRPDEALALLQQAVRRVQQGPSRARALAKLADIFSEQFKNDVAATSLLELAVLDTPGDNDLRFKLAYSYTKKSLHSAALFHYREIIGRDKKYNSATNNAGVAAGHLKMPMLSVGYYRRAQDHGEGLSSANLAKLLLSEGFVEEARKELERGSSAEEPHRDVLSVLGDIASKETAEEESLKTVLDSAKRWREFSRVVAAALVDERPAVSEMAGLYRGTPSNLVLSVEESGRVSGSFAHQEGKAAILTGTLRGRCLQFTWESVQDPQENRYLALLSMNRTGHGLLIATKDKLDGYFAPTEEPVAELWEVARTDWHLVKGEVLPELPIGAPLPAIAPVRGILARVIAEGAKTGEVKD